MSNIQNTQRFTLPEDEFQSFAQVLQYRARVTPTEEAFTFYNENRCKEEVSVSYANLDKRARQIALRLSQYMNAGDRCLLLFKPGVEYLAAFFACLYARVIAVPVFMPNLNGIESNIDKLRGILNDCSGKIILSSQEHSDMINILLESSELEVECLFSDNFSTDDCFKISENELNSNETAFLQYTSGSTSRPKGVEITHKNLLTNAAIIGKQFNFQSDSKGVIWLPPYHDMGLIGGVLAAIYGGINLVLTPPITFIQNPLQWLNLISKYGGTISGGPNFAYDLCVKHMKKRPMKDLDLSCWKVAFCGAEPIRGETLKDFVETFSLYGFAKETFYPCYGLAESTLMVSSKTSHSKPITRFFNIEKFNRNIIEEVNIANNKNITEIVSCGEIIPEHLVCIVDPKTMKAVKEKIIGEIWVKGNSVAKGYWNNVAENTNSFNATLADSYKNNGWLRTGDLGFFIDKELFITGRLKELIIINGVNYYPQDIEKIVESSHDYINASVVFSITHNNSDEFVIVIEVARKYINDDVGRVIGAVRKSIADNFSLHVRDIIIVRPKSIPRTSSGKIQRILSKTYYLNNKFDVLISDMHDINILNKSINVENVLSVIANYVGITETQLQIYNSLSDLGLDSIQLIELKNIIEQHFHTSIDTYTFLDDLSLSTLVEKIEKQTKDKEQEKSILNNAECDEYIPLNPTQNALWLMYQLDSKSVVYNISRCFSIDDQINLLFFSQVIEHLVAEQVNLRSTFQNTNVGACQKIHATMFAGTINYENVQHFDDAQLNARIKSLASEPFILERGPLFKIYIFILSPKEYRLLFLAHHIIIDFWSINIFYKRISELYVDLSKNKAITLSKVSTYQSCINYNNWYKQYLCSDQYTYDLNFWLMQYEKPLHAKKQVMIKKDKLANFNLIEFSFSKNQMVQLKEFCKINRVTPFNLTLTIFTILLALTNKDEEVIVGLPFALRDFSDAASFMGYCVNLLPMRLEISNNLTILKLVEKVKSLLFLMLQHKNFPFSHLVEKAKIPRRIDNRLPIFHALFLYQSSQYFDESLSLCGLNANEGKIYIDNILLNMQSILPPDGQLELTLSVATFDDSIRFVIEYESSLFNLSQAKYFVDTYSAVFDFLITHTEVDFSFLSNEPKISTLLMEIPSIIVEDELKHDTKKNNARYFEIEEKLIVLWKNILNNEGITNQDNFFSSGGTSLLAIKLAAEVTDIFKIKFDVRSVFLYQTLALLAEHIADLPMMDTSSGIKSIKRVAYGRSEVEK